MSGLSAAPARKPGRVHVMAAGIDASAWALKCDGTTYNVAQYPALAAKLGATYGGDGATTFAVPDYRGRFIRGLDDGAGVDSGRAVGSYQADGYASHNHHINDPGHNHSWHTSNGNSGGGYVTGSTGGPSADHPWNVTSKGTGITMNTSGGNETRPKNVAERHWIEF